jgi:hypothetical protein
LVQGVAWHGCHLRSLNFVFDACDVFRVWISIHELGIWLLGERSMLNGI